MSSAPFDTDTDEPVAIVQKNSSDEVRISVGTYRSHPVTNMRVWFTPNGGGEKRPGKQGFALNPAKLPDFIKGLQAAYDKAREKGLV